jgi:hypothetical protein
MEEPKQPLTPFEPVPVRARHDGWTVKKQYAFVEALAETGVVEEACRRVGMSRTSADKLRSRTEGVHFRRAWEAAMDYALYRVEEDSHARARRGVVRPIFHKGEQVGEYRHFDERLTMFLLRSYRPERYGRTSVRIDPPGWDDEPGPLPDPGGVLEGELTGIEFLAEDVMLDGDEDDAPTAL